MQQDQLEQDQRANMYALVRVHVEDPKFVIVINYGSKILQYIIVTVLNFTQDSTSN